MAKMSYFFSIVCTKCPDLLIQFFSKQISINVIMFVNNSINESAYCVSNLIKRFND